VLIWSIRLRGCSIWWGRFGSRSQIRIRIRIRIKIKIKIKIKILKIKSACLGAGCFAFGELLGKVESRTIPK
jgi:hypothetical protein